MHVTFISLFYVFYLSIWILFEVRCGLFAFVDDDPRLWDLSVLIAKPGVFDGEGATRLVYAERTFL